MAFYRSILTAPVRSMRSLKEAEAVKVVENSFRDINIAFVNELAMSFTTLGIDIMNVLNGAETKPFSFMKHVPGLGVGGHCIPVDPYYLITYAEKNGFNHRFLRAAREVNNGMPQFTARQLSDVAQLLGRRLSESHIALLGLTYKPDVSDLRESPAIALLRLLRRKGAFVEAYDPFVLDEVGHPRPHHSNTVLNKILQKSDIVLLATGHSVFRNINGEQLQRSGVQAVVDGRNFWDKEDIVAHGIAYRGIGR